MEVTHIRVSTEFLDTVRFGTIPHVVGEGSAVTKRGYEVVAVVGLLGVALYGVRVW